MKTAREKRFDVVFLRRCENSSRPCWKRKKKRRKVSAVDVLSGDDHPRISMGLSAVLGGSNWFFSLITSILSEMSEERAPLYINSWDKNDETSRWI